MHVAVAEAPVERHAARIAADRKANADPVKRLRPGMQLSKLEVATRSRQSPL